MAFHAGETVICKATILDEDGQLVDPSTSMKITITDSKNGIEVDDQAMVKDSTGLYHYDWNTLDDAPAGIYKVIYTATDDTRVSIAVEKIEIVQEVKL